MSQDKLGEERDLRLQPLTVAALALVSVVTSLSARTRPEPLVKSGSP